MVSKRKCPCCLQVKPASDFYKNPNTTSGLEKDCKQCKLEKAKVARTRKAKEINHLFGLRFRVERLEAAMRKAGLMGPEETLLKTADQAIGESE